MSSLIAFAGIELEREALMGKAKEKVLDELKDFTEIREIYEVMAPFDLMIKVDCQTINTLRTLISHINNTPGVRCTTITLTTATIKRCSHCH